MSDDGLPPIDTAAEPAKASQDKSANAADTKTYRRKKRDAELALREGDAFWSRCLRDPVGRRELYALLAGHGAFKNEFKCGPTGFPHPEATWFAAGQHSMCRDIIAALTRIDRANYFLMLDEHDPRYARPEGKPK